MSRTFLAEAEEKLNQRREDLSQAEQDFIGASVALRDREQKQRERARQRIILGLSAGLVFSLGLYGFAETQRQEARTRGNCIREMVKLPNSELQQVKTEVNNLMRDLNKSEDWVLWNKCSDLVSSRE